MEIVCEQTQIKTCICSLDEKVVKQRAWVASWQTISSDPAPASDFIETEYFDTFQSPQSKNSRKWLWAADHSCSN